jgi:hypothetical protein
MFKKIKEELENAVLIGVLLFIMWVVGSGILAICNAFQSVLN